MNNLPGRAACVCKEHACFLIFDRIQWVIRIDVFREEVRLGEHNLCKLGIIDLVAGSPHVGFLKDRPISIEKTLVVSKMVWKDLKVVSKEWETASCWTH